jgi:ketosteroid isomerase-like protein
MARLQVALFAFLTLSPGAQPDAETTIRQFLKDLVALQLKPDAQKLEQFYWDDFQATNAAGAVLNKRAVIGALTSGKLRFLSYKLEEVRVKVYGDLAVVTDAETIESNTGVIRARHLRVLLNRDGQWRLIVTQMTRIP